MTILRWCSLKSAFSFHLVRRVAYYDDNSIKNYTLYTFSSPTSRVWSKLLVNQFILPCKAHILRKHFGLLQGSLHQILTRAQSWFRFTGIDISFTLSTPTEFVAALLTIGDLKAGVGSWGWRMNWCEVRFFYDRILFVRKPYCSHKRERKKLSGLTDLLNLFLPETVSWEGFARFLIHRSISRGIGGGRSQLIRRWNGEHTKNHSNV